jgi:hypothetical protein
MTPCAPGTTGASCVKWATAVDASAPGVGTWAMSMTKAAVWVRVARCDEDELGAPHHLAGPFHVQRRIVFGSRVVDLAGGLVDLLVAGLGPEQRRDHHAEPGGDFCAWCGLSGVADAEPVGNGRRPDWTLARIGSSGRTSHLQPFFSHRRNPFRSRSPNGSSRSRVSRAAPRNRLPRCALDVRPRRRRPHAERE